jgi:hypothetical protein
LTDYYFDEKEIPSGSSVGSVESVGYSLNPEEAEDQNRD